MTKHPRTTAPVPAPCTTAPASAQLATLRSCVDEATVAHTAARVLYWDERVNMGSASGEWRARQRAVTARRAHEVATSPALERAIIAAEEVDPDLAEVQHARRYFDRASQLSSDIVEERAAATSRARAAWAHAREHDEFTHIRPELERMLAHARQIAEHLGYESEPYDALLSSYEPGVTAAMLERLFAELTAGMRPIIARAEARQPADLSVINRHMSLAAKLEFERQALEVIGFDSLRGRVDGAARAFCIRLGPDDVRIVTRFHSMPGLSAFTSSLHEAGHAIYRQAFDRLGVPASLADIASLGIDESQSRLFENNIGRGRELWHHLFPLLTAASPGVFDDVTADTIHAALTSVKRSLIRIDADELTYNLHIAVRFELERAMVNGELTVADLPEAWRESMERIVGVAPDNDRDGCLQDVHWSIGQWGYFPGYTLGNVYAAQLMRAARSAMPALDDDFARGDFSSLHSWLDRNVYCFGSSIEGAELARRVDGEVDATALVSYLDGRYG